MHRVHYTSFTLRRSKNDTLVTALGEESMVKLTVQSVPKKSPLNEITSLTIRRHRGEETEGMSAGHGRETEYINHFWKLVTIR